MPKIVTDEQIFEAVLTVVTRYGYSGATTKEIAAVAGINEATLFRKYGSKAELVVQTMTYQAERMDIEAMAQYTGNVAEDLKRIASIFYDTRNERKDLFTVIFAEMPRYPELERALARPLDIVSNVSKLIARYQDEGILIRENPVHTVSALIGPLIAETLIANLDAGIQSPDIDQHVTNFLNGRSLIKRR